MVGLLLLFRRKELGYSSYVCIDGMEGYGSNMGELFSSPEKYFYFPK